MDQEPSEPNPPGYEATKVLPGLGGNFGEFRPPSGYDGWSSYTISPNGFHHVDADFNENILKKETVENWWANMEDGELKEEAINIEIPYGQGVPIPSSTLLNVKYGKYVYFQPGKWTMQQIRDADPQHLPSSINPDTYRGDTDWVIPAVIEFRQRLEPGQVLTQNGVFSGQDQPNNPGNTPAIDLVPQDSRSRSAGGVIVGINEESPDVPKEFQVKLVKSGEVGPWDGTDEAPFGQNPDDDQTPDNYQLGTFTVDVRTELGGLKTSSNENAPVIPFYFDSIVDWTLNNPAVSNWNITGQWDGSAKDFVVVFDLDTLMDETDVIDREAWDDETIAEYRNKFAVVCIHTNAVTNAQNDALFSARWFFGVRSTSDINDEITINGSISNQMDGALKHVKKVGLAQCTGETGFFSFTPFYLGVNDAQQSIPAGYIGNKITFLRRLPVTDFVDDWYKPETEIFNAGGGCLWPSVNYLRINAGQQLLGEISYVFNIFKFDKKEYRFWWN